MGPALILNRRHYLGCTPRSTWNPTSKPTGSQPLVIRLVVMLSRSVPMVRLRGRTQIWEDRNSTQEPRIHQTTWQINVKCFNKGSDGFAPSLHHCWWIIKWNFACQINIKSAFLFPRVSPQPDEHASFRHISCCRGVGGVPDSQGVIG